MWTIVLILGLLKIYKDNGRITQGFFFGTLTASLFLCNYASMHILITLIDHVLIRVGNVLKFVNIRISKHKNLPVGHRLRVFQLS